ncbi:MAG: DUF4846 domain-containing protein [Spirochaetia bacterium]|nr:DUF4846 domain-containing protein [Spirochaetia bacterium]
MKKSHSIEKVKNIRIPEDFKRTIAKEGTYESWLRNLPLHEKGKKVRLFNNKQKNNQNAHYRVMDIDTGNKDLQQCADAIIRLVSEYYFSVKHYDKIKFNFTSGQPAKFKKWAEGYRPIVKGRKTVWRKIEEKDYSYENFREYLETVFYYAGTYSLEKELVKIKNTSKIEIGDVFIQGGFPGHAVFVIDKAYNKNTKETIVLLAQSFMPAQEIHILKNFEEKKISPWYTVKKEGKLITPEWIFNWSDLRRFLN